MYRDIESLETESEHYCDSISGFKDLHREKWVYSFRL